MLADPTDAIRLIYADWLEDQGRPEATTLRLPQENLSWLRESIWSGGYGGYGGSGGYGGYGGYGGDGGSGGDGGYGGDGGSGG